MEGRGCKPRTGLHCGENHTSLELFSMQGPWGQRGSCQVGVADPHRMPGNPPRAAQSKRAASPRGWLSLSSNPSMPQVPSARRKTPEKSPPPCRSSPSGHRHRRPRRQWFWDSKPRNGRSGHLPATRRDGWTPRSPSPRPHPFCRGFSNRRIPGRSWRTGSGRRWDYR